MIRRKECDWDPFPVSLMRDMAERRHNRVGGADGLSIGHCSGKSLPGDTGDTQGETWPHGKISCGVIAVRDRVGHRISRLHGSFDHDCIETSAIILYL